MVLTPKQSEVVVATRGHYVVLAGPGCGKTHTITEKILHFFDKEIIPEPYGLLAITFTDNAARIMRARLRSKGFNQWERVWIGTFHSFGRYILSCYGSEIGIREDFEIIELDKRDYIVDQLIKKHSIDYSLYDLKSLFEKFKQKGIYPNQNNDYTSPIIHEVYTEYNKILREKNCLDFGDLIALAVQLLKKSDFVRKLYTQFFCYVIVDEFQDTDEQQLDMIQLIAQPAIGSTIVGDDDQSIFGWRGAIRKNVYKIKECLDSTEIILSQNFRSDEIIVEAAAKVIGFDLERRERDMESVSKERGQLYKYEFNNTKEEAKCLVERINNILIESKVDDPGNIAIITRNNYRTPWIISEMERAGIPYFDRSRLNFQDSWETSLGLAIIELACNPGSSLSLYRLLSAIEDGGIAFRLGYEDAFDLALMIRDQLINIISENFDTYSERIQEILVVINMDEIIKKASASNSDARQRKNNLQKMTDEISSEAENKNMKLIDVINQLLGFGAIQIITGHHSKGGEFDIVFFIGLEDDVIPDYRTYKDNDKLAEERRIFYVGLTRARKTAYLTSVKNRPMQGWVKKSNPSRFIDHIPEEYFSVIIF